MQIASFLESRKISNLIFDFDSKKKNNGNISLFPYKYIFCIH